MSDTASVAQVHLPGTDDIRKIVAVLREDMTGEVLSEAADRLVMLAGAESHPLAKAALLERAAKLVLDKDEQRAVMLLRESFRLLPKREVGELLRDRGLEEPSLQRLSRMSFLFDSIAALHEDGPSQRDALFGATAFHLAQGHAQRAIEAIDKIEALGAGDRAEEMQGLRDAAKEVVSSSDEKLSEKRQQIVEAPDQFRGKVLFEYAQLLLAGDAELTDSSAVLEDAVEQGADAAVAAPLWAEVARAAGEPDMLARALAACIRGSELPHEKVRHADELANLPGIDDDNPELALAALDTLTEAMPDDIGLRARWLSARARRGDAEAASELDKLRLTAVKERNRVAEAAICLALARIATAAGDTDKVERHLRRVRTLDPRNVEALDFFERRYRSANDHQRLYLVLTHRLAISSGSDVVRIAFEMAELAEGPMANEERAIEAYHRILAVDAENQSALAKLEDLYRSTSRWNSVRDLLDRRARSQETRMESDSDAAKAAAELLEKLAAMHREDGDDPDVTALFETLRRLLAADPSNTVAADELADHYRRDRRWRHLAGVLETRLEHDADKQSRAGIARELYDVHRNKLGDSARALQALETVVTDSPDDLESLRMLEEAYRHSSDDAGYLSVLTKIRPLVKDTELVRVLEEMSALTERGDSAAEAVALYEALNEARPAHPGARRGLTRLYGEVGKHEKLADLLDLRLTEEQLDNAEKADLYEKLALTAAEHLGDMPRAESAAKALRQVQPTSQIGAEIAQRVMLGRADFEGLRAVYSSDRPGAELFVAGLRTMASARSDAIGVRGLLAAASAMANEMNAVEGAAEAAAEALDKATDCDDPELTTETAQALLGFAETAQRSDLQMLAVAVMIEGADGEIRLMHMAHRVALCEDADDWDGAYEAVTALVAERLAASDVEGMGGAADRVADLAERAGQEEEVPLLLCAWADTLTEGFADASDSQPDVATAVVELLARALDQSLMFGGELDTLREQVEAALAAMSDNADVLSLREQVCTEQGDWAAVVDTMRRQAESAEGDERIDLLLRAANRSDIALSDHKAAAKLYDEVTQAQPDNAEAWSGLLDALRAGDDEKALNEASGRFLQSPVDDRPGKAVVAIQRISGLMDTDAAADVVNAVFGPVLATIAENDGLLDAEDGILAIASGRLELEEGSTELARLLLPAAQRHDRAEEAQRCFAILGSALPEGSEERRAMLRTWATAAQAAEDHEAALSAWTLLREDDPTSLDALDALEMLHREAEDHDAVAIMLEERLTAELDDEDREATWLRLADGHLTDRDDAAEALSVLERAVAESPSSEALAALRLGVLREHGAPADQVTALDACAAGELDTDVKRELATEAATLVQEALSDRAGALARWLTLLQDDPTDDNATKRSFELLLAGEQEGDDDAAAAPTEAAQQLTDILQLRGEYERLDKVLQLRIDAAADDAKVALLRQQLQVREEELQDIRAAFQTAATALRLAPDDDALYAATERLAGDGDEAAKLSLMAARAGAEKNPTKRKEALLKHARYATELGQQDSAIDSWELLLKFDDAEAQMEAAAALVEVHEEAGNHAKHAEALTAQQQLTEDDEAKVAMAVMIAEQWLAAGQFDKAIACLSSAAQAAPTDLAVWAAMDTALRTADDKTALRVHLQRGWQTVFGDDDHDSRQIALDEQIALESADATPTEQRWATIQSARDAGLESDDLNSALANVAKSASDLQDAQDRKALRMAAAMAALGQEQHEAAATLLDEVLQDNPADEDAYALRSSAIDELPEGKERNERLGNHYAHGVAHLAEPGLKRVAQLQLADHTASSGADPKAAFKIVAAALTDAEDDKDDKDDLYRLAEVYAEQAELTEELWELLEVEAKDAEDEAAEKWLSLAMRTLAHDQHHGQARRYAEQAREAGGDVDSVVMVLDTVLDAGIAVDDALIDLLVTHHSEVDAGRAAALLMMRADRASSKKAKITALGTLSDLTQSAAGRSAGLDALGPLRALALAEPKKSGRWTALRDIAGEERAGDALDSVMTAFEETAESDPALRHSLLLVASEIAESARDSESAASYLRMALDEVDRPKSRKRLHALLETNGSYGELAIDLEEQAQLHPKDAVALLERALTCWLDHEGDAERGMLVLELLLAAAPERVDLADRRLDIMRLNGHDEYADVLAEAVQSARKNKDNERLVGLLPRVIAVRSATLTPQERFGLLRELVGLSASSAALASFVDEMAAVADELEPEQTQLAFKWLLENVDPSAEPQRYAGARLQQIAAIDDPQQQLVILDELVAHAGERLKDADSGVEWASRALLLDATNDTRVAALLDAIADDDQAATALPALQASLEVREGEARASVETLTRVLRLDPDDEATLKLIVPRCDDAVFCAAAAEAVVPLLRDAGRHNAAASITRRSIEHLAPGERGAAVIELAMTMSQDLGQPDAAIRLMIEAAPALEEPDELIDMALELARENNSIDEWLEAVEQAVGDGRIAGPTATSVVAQAAAIAVETHGDAARAAELWTRLWDADANDEDARDAVLAMRREAGDAERLAADLERALILGGANVDELNIELATLYHTEMARSREALGSVRTVLRKNPTDKGAIKLANQLVEVSSCRKQALTLLQQAYRAAEDWEKLAEVLGKVAEATGDRGRVRALEALASLQKDQLGQPEKALNSLTHALELAPSAKMLERAVAIAAEHASKETPARLFDLALNGPLAADDRPEVLVAAAEHYQHEREDAAKAEALWRELLQIAPTHAAAYDGLDAILEASDRWDELLKMMESRLRHVRGTATEQSILHRLGAIAQATQRNDIAIDAFEQLARLEPDNDEHLEAVVELLRSARNPRKLVDMLEKLAGVQKEDSQQARTLTEGGHICAGRLEDAARAERLFLAAFELDPGADEAYKWLERKHANNAQKLQKLYQHRSSGVEAGPSRTRVLRKLASVFNELGRAAQAKAVLDKARQEDPDNHAIDDDLLALCQASGDRAGYEEVARRKLKGTLARPERAELLTELTKFALEKGGDAGKWMDELRDVAENSAEMRSLAGFVQAASGDPEVAVTGLEQVLNEADNDTERIAIFEKLAVLYQGKINRPTRAIAAYQKVLKIEPLRADIQQKLADLFRVRGSLEALVETLRKWLSSLEDGVQKVPVMAQLAQAQLDFGDRVAALKTLEQAYELDRNTLEVNQPLAMLLRDEKQLERAAELQSWVVDQLRRERRKTALPEAATIAGEMLSELEQHKTAQRYFRMALHADRNHLEATLGLGRSYLSLKDATRAMAEFEKVSRLPASRASVEHRAEAHIDVARCWLSQNKGAHARTALKKALTIDAGNATATKLLNEI